jgi:hypothetical protein
MQEDGTSQELVSRNELEELSSLFDQFQYSDDPTSPETQKTEDEFNKMADDIYTGKVKPEYSDISLDEFRGLLFCACKKFLRTQDKKKLLPKKITENP